MDRRALYHARPPASQTKLDMHPTLLISWWCTGFALAVILVRVGGRYVRTEKLFREDKIMAASTIPLMARMALVHVILIWGTNNTATDTLTAIDVQHRQTGSKLVLASRILYAAFIWTAKLTVLEFLKRIIGAHWRKSYEIGLQVVRYFLLVTFIGVIITTLTECQPFYHYWQVIPDPGPQCRESIAQLLTMGICDMITDLLLVVYPIPIVIQSAMPVKRKVSLVLLFALSLALVAITAFRVPSTIRRRSAQQYRSLLASLEILAAAAVSNSIVIGSFIRNRGAKKAKYRRESTGGSSSLARTMTARTTIAHNQWGSDSDLAGDLGISLTPNLQSRKSSVPSVAPISRPLPVESSLAEKGEISRRGREGDLSSISTNSTNLKREIDSTESPAETMRPPSTPKKMSFFDVGSLMQGDANSSPDQSSKSSLGRSQQPVLDHVAESPTSNQPQSQGHESSPEDASPSIVDVGGLLSTSRSADLDRSTALPPAARQHLHSNHLQTAPSEPPSVARNFSRGGSAYSQRGQSKSRSTAGQQPPPVYRPRRASDIGQWNGAGAASSMDIVDAGGLLK
jgi:hypothetical protein